MRITIRDLLIVALLVVVPCVMFAQDGVAPPIETPEINKTLLTESLWDAVIKAVGDILQTLLLGLAGLASYHLQGYIGEEKAKKVEAKLKEYAVDAAMAAEEVIEAKVKNGDSSLANKAEAKMKYAVEYLVKKAGGKPETAEAAINAVLPRLASVGTAAVLRAQKELEAKIEAKLAGIASTDTENQIEKKES